MFSFFKRRRKPTAESGDFASEWRRLRDRHADPALEHATTKQALIVSAASVLDRKWNAHGGSTWAASDEEDFIAPLQEYLVDPEVFSPADCAEITAALDAIVAVGRRNLRRIEEHEGAGNTEEGIDLEPADAPVEIVVGYAVAWCKRRPEPVPLQDADEYFGHD